MTKKNIRLLASLILVIGFLVVEVYKQYTTPGTDVLSEKITPTVAVQRGVVVSKVIDGDTVDVTENGVVTKIRIIGINTPETVDPRKEVECYGKEASEKAKQLLLNQKVRIESDPTQSDKDRYGRSLRYIILPSNVDYGLEMVKSGYAYEYTYNKSYQKQAEYVQAQNEAVVAGRGLWAVNTCNGQP